jgi:hypothetical protein
VYDISGLTIHSVSQVLVVCRNEFCAGLAELPWQAVGIHGRAKLGERLEHGVVHVLVGEIAHVDGSAADPHLCESLAVVEEDVVVVGAYKKSALWLSTRRRVRSQLTKLTRPMRQTRMLKIARMLDDCYDCCYRKERSFCQSK